MTAELSAAEREQLLAQLIAGNFPDRHGRYGPFGGRFVPETLVPAHERLEQGVRRWLADEDFQRELQLELSSWAGRPTRIEPRAAALAPLGRGGVAQARGSRAYRRAQDQQRARTGAAGAAPGREAHRRRDRRRPARRGERGGLRARRTALHGVHGRGGHGAPGAQRRAHAFARRHGGERDQRRSDPARGHRRGDARLGGRSGRQLLPAGLVRRARIPILTWCANCRA